MGWLITCLIVGVIGALVFLARKKETFAGSRPPATTAGTPSISPSIERRYASFHDVLVKYPGHVLGSGESIAMVAAGFAKVITIKFSPLVFDEVLVKSGVLKRMSPAGWTSADALSRWYALGLICLTHCAKTKMWSSSFGIETGLKIHDATAEIAWRWWEMPEEVSARVKAFMRSNIKNVTSSLESIVDTPSKQIWFTRYSERLVKGSNSPWVITPKNDPDFWRTELGWQGTDPFYKKSGEMLCHLFTDTWKSIERLANGEDLEYVLATPQIPQNLASHSPHRPTVSEENSPSDGYPSEERVRQVWQAWKECGEEGLLRLFKDEEESGRS